MNVTEQRLRETENKLVHLWREGRWEEGNKKTQTTMYKINKPQEYIAQHQNYNQYFIF